MPTDTGPDHAPALTPKRRSARDRTQCSAMSRRPPRYLHEPTAPQPAPTGPCVYLSHILFKPAPGQDVHALRLQAERVLLALTCAQARPDDFARLARQWSACPSAKSGGDVGWVSPQDCAPELANELFDMREPAWGMGVHPRLVHTELGFHIVRVLGRRHPERRPSPTDIPLSL